MKILHLKFSNLNSLTGTWEIDFTDPSFASSGIFVITGPTGSGKTTVLDAMCLALYGRTPRLGRITRTTNHIMSRHTGDCYAEVVFESQKGRYICHWSQKRARNKPDGELQQPKHEIARKDCGEILASKVSHVPEIVKEVTGMDYDQFTRSILLAQGGFAAFLQAGADERAPILEQITGTAIYSDISIKTHERFVRETELLDQLNRELDLISVLSPEEKENCETQIRSLNSRVRDTDESIIKTTETIRWIETVEKLYTDIGNLSGEKERLDIKQAAFEPELRRLMAAQKAVSFQGLYEPLQVKRDSLQKDTEKITQAKIQHDSFQTSLAELEGSVSTACTRMIQADQEREAGLACILVVRALDARIKDGEAVIIKEKHELDDLQTQISTYKSRKEIAERRQQEILDTKKRATGYINDHTRDAGLREEYSGIEHKANHLRDLLKSIDEEKKETENETNLLTRAEKERKELLISTEIQRKSLEKKIEEQKSLQREVEDLLKGSSISDLRRNREEVRIRTEALTRLSAIQSEIIGLKQRLEILDKKQEDLIHYLQIAGDEKERIRSDIAHHEIHLEAKRKTAVLSAKVRDLTEERNRLVDGSPCPLCGSLHHPYVSEQVIEADDAFKEVAEEENIIKVLTTQLTTLTGALAEKDGELKRCIDDINDTGEKIKEESTIWREMTEALDIDEETDVSPLIALMEDAATVFSATDKKIQDIERCEEKIRKEAPFIAKGSELLTTLEKDCREKEYTIESGKTRIKQLQDQIFINEEKIAVGIKELNLTLAGFGSDISRDTPVDPLLLNLRNRLKKFLEEETRVKTCEEDLRKIEPEISELTGKISEKEDEIIRKTGHIRCEEKKTDDLRDERKRQFGEKDTGNEEKRLKEAVSQAKEIYEAKQKERTELSDRVFSVKGLISDLEKRIEENTADIQKGLEEFLIHIRQAGFENEGAYHSALLPPHEKERLEREWEGIRTEQTRIEERQKNAQSRYEEERRRNLTDKPAPDLKSELETLTEEKSRLISETGRYRERLSRHEEMSRLQGEKLNTRERRQQEVDKWSRLHTLIGSADGKKFRVFAQGLTFCTLLHHANEHLHKMTDRYALIQDSEMPLDMQVIDTWQGGVVRSVKNLSGGEVFMVSLALALGLSGMASRNVRVDSLFLDEGFGSLDDEALDTALSTISGLRQEGKLIGVISHVAALKERIHTQIIIKKGNNGQSRIIIPG